MLLKKSTFVRKNDMIWQKYGVTQERGEERLTKKVRKKYVGGGSTAKECDATHSKKKKKFCKRRSSRCFLTFDVFFMSVFVDDVITFLWNK